MGEGSVTRTWPFGEGRIEPNVVEMNLRRGQLNAEKRDGMIEGERPKRERDADAQDTQGEPHVIVRG